MGKRFKNEDKKFIFKRLNFNISFYSEIITNSFYLFSSLEIHHLINKIIKKYKRNNIQIFN